MPPSGKTISWGNLIATRSGSTATVAVAVTVSLTHLKPTTTPAKRDIAIPCNPKSRYSWIVAGKRTGIELAAKAGSD
ncbi:MAG TPA: hypothetical protein EYM43_01315 [Alphaproteobacteria bacterium]|nr:hypothetical protein [Alphaproteobacteria bacterium]